jgi:hypothetical protein
MEESPLQDLEIFSSIVYGFPPIIFGTFFGYILGSKEKIPSVYRALLCAIISVGGGYLLAQYALDLLIPVTFNFIILSIMGFAGGVILGMILNWKPYQHVPIPQHILYEPEDEEEFDKELDDAIHGHNH